MTTVITITHYQRAPPFAQALTESSVCTYILHQWAAHCKAALVTLSHAKDLKLQATWPD